MWSGEGWRARATAVGSVRTQAIRIQGRPLSPLVTLAICTRPGRSPHLFTHAIPTKQARDMYNWLSATVVVGREKRAHDERHADLYSPLTGRSAGHAAAPPLEQHAHALRLTPVTSRHSLTLARPTSSTNTSSTTADRPPTGSLILNRESRYRVTMNLLLMQQMYFDLVAIFFIWSVAPGMNLEHSGCKVSWVMSSGFIY